MIETCCLFCSTVGFFEKCSLTMKDNGKLFMSQEDYYKILDIKIDNKRNRTLYDFLSSRNLSLDDHRVCIVFVVLKLRIVSCWWLRGNDSSWALLKKGHRYYRIRKYSITMQYCMPQFWKKIPKLPIFSQKWPDFAFFLCIYMYDNLWLKEVQYPWNYFSICDYIICTVWYLLISQPDNL